MLTRLAFCRQIFTANAILLFFFYGMFPFFQLAAAEEDRGAAIVEISQPHRDAGKSVIVVIGIDDYIHWKKLRNAVSDAKVVQAVFVEKFGFSAPIPPLINGEATKSAIHSLVEDRLRKILEVNDRLILFFAGHGHTRVDSIGGKNVETGFIVPVGARTGTKEQWNDYVKLEDLLETVGTLPARQVFVILDSCHSGFAVGGSMKTFRAAERYEGDLASRVSRRVVTSAMQDQLARDNGPIPGHSLFAGTLIDGLNWGKSDLDGNGLVTSSELSLYLQQQVAQASESKQTPDSGAFHYDDRGELVLSLHNQTFDALKARTMTALHRGRVEEFRVLANEVMNSRPNSAEALYLQYRLLLHDRNIDEATKAIVRLRSLRLTEGIIPLSSYDPSLLGVQLPYWKSVLTLPDGESHLLLELISGNSKDSLGVLPEKQIGDVAAYLVHAGEFMQVKVRNRSDQQLYVYMIQIDQDGRVMPIRLWQEAVLWSGLPPKSLHNTLLFRDGGQTGMSEWRFLATTMKIIDLFAPPSYAARGASVPLQLPDQSLNELQVKTLRYIVDGSGGIQ